MAFLELTNNSLVPFPAWIKVLKQSFVQPRQIGLNSPMQGARTEGHLALASPPPFVYPSKPCFKKGWTRSSVGLERQTTDLKVTGSSPVGSAI